MMKRKLVSKRILQGLLLLVISFFAMQGWFFWSTGDQIVGLATVDASYNVALVLGASVRQGQPSPMLKERLDTALMLYTRGIVDRILVSGDNGTLQYNEVAVMSAYLLQQGVPAENVFQDYAGFDTYDSIYRAREIFQIDRMLIVTQKFHLSRAIAIANDLDIEVQGVVADRQEFDDTLRLEMREFGARTKAFAEIVFGSKAKYGGKIIDIEGESNTQDFR